MTALILFTRELAAELLRIADITDEELKSLDGSKDPAEQVTMIVGLATANTLRWVSKAISVAAKRAFHL